MNLKQIQAFIRLAPIPPRKQMSINTKKPLKLWTKYIKIMEELLKRNRRNQEITQLVKKKSSGTFSATLFYKNFMILLEHTGGKLFFFFNCFPGSTNSITFGRGRLAFFSVQEPCKRKQYSQIYT